MRFSNNNKAIMNKLTKKSIGVNKLRNLFLIAAIALTTILFTTLFTIGMGMLESMEQQTMRQAGGYAHGSFKYLTREKFNNIKDHPLIKELGYSIMIGMGENKELLKHHTEVRYATNTQAKMFFDFPTMGKMPQKEKEIATDTKVLDLLGVPHKIGEKITIEYIINKEKLSTEFTLCGFWEGDKVSPASMVFVSRGFIDKNLGNANIDKAEGPVCSMGIDTGRIFVDVMFKNSLNIEENMEKVLIDRSYSSDPNSPNYIATGVNWAYMSTNLNIDFTTIISVLSASILIIFTGYLIIYNIFQISVIKDIRFYGLLKTIGTTPRQIKRLVRKQAILLSFIGIPIGLIVGYLIGNVLLPIILSTTNVETSYISFSPLIFIGAAIFAFVTVFISCRKPGKIASKVSPIEATRYVDVTSIYRKKEKNSLNGGKIHNMAFSNILRNKRKTIVVVISMSLSLILLNSVFTFTRGFDMNQFLNKFVITDFTVSNANYFNVNRFRSEEDIVSEQMINRIDSLEDIENSGRIYYNIKRGDAITTIDSQKIYIQLYGLEDFPLSQFSIFEGELDLEKFKTGNYIIEGVSTDDNGNIEYEESKYDIGDKVAIEFQDNIIKEYEVMAKAKLSHSMSARYYIMGARTMYLPANEFVNQIKNPLTMSYLFNVKDEYIGQTEDFLQDYTNNIDPQMDYESKQKYIDEFKNFQNMWLLVGGILSFVIGIIGILNFINAILTSIISRRMEFAMLQSIGMTNSQLNKMLLFEGLFYALATIGISILLGSLSSLLIVQPIASSIWFYKYRFIIDPILIASPILILISIFVPFTSYLSVNRQTIVERLREAE